MRLKRRKTKSLPAAQKELYREQGFLVIDNVLTNAQVTALRQRLENLCSDWETEAAQRVNIQQEADFPGALTKSRTPETVRKFAGLVRAEPLFRSFALDSDLMNMAAELIGSPVDFFVDQAFLKPPFIGSETPVHQDNAWFRIHPDAAVIGCWCALDEATADNGCMRYLPGSHQRGLLEHKPFRNTSYWCLPQIDLSQTVSVPVKAGSVIFHHSCTVHYSPPNPTPLWRRAFVCYYISSALKASGVPA
ncbi:MAG: phytanoyl-CoA dioxygenase family protein [Victivallaceae bacterium]|nr:phytanoyl-CoA dioxygenase family protein [Victivallaceae bacterium]